MSTWFLQNSLGCDDIEIGGKSKDASVVATTYHNDKWYHKQVNLLNWI